MEKFEIEFKREIAALKSLNMVAAGKPLMEKIDYHFQTNAHNHNFGGYARTKMASLAFLILLLILAGSITTIGNSKPGSYLYPVKVLFNKISASTGIQNNTKENTHLNFKPEVATPSKDNFELGQGENKSAPNVQLDKDLKNSKTSDVNSHTSITPTPDVQVNISTPLVEVNTENTVNTLLEETINNSTESGINLDIKLPLPEVKLPL